MEGFMPNHPLGDLFLLILEEKGWMGGGKSSRSRSPTPLPPTRQVCHGEGGASVSDSARSYGQPRLPGQELSATDYGPPWCPVEHSTRAVLVRAPCGLR